MVIGGKVYAAWKQKMLYDVTLQYMTSVRTPRDIFIDWASDFAAG